MAATSIDPDGEASLDGPARRILRRRAVLSKRVCKLKARLRF
jgi:hypothetical protein